MWDVVAAILDPLPKPSADSDRLQAVLSIVFAVTGAMALLIMTVGGLRFVLSRGNPQSVAQAKNTVVYAAVGLVISISALAIVTFVLGGL